MDMAQNILVIKTVSGMAMAVAAALDAIKFHEVVGCIAGDDTIMCAVRSVDDTIIVMERSKNGRRLNRIRDIRFCKTYNRKRGKACFLNSM